MRVVLQRPVENLGQPGDVVEVADGYARNFLVPRGLAVKAHKGMVRHSESLKRAHEARLSKQREEFDALAQRLAAEGPLRIWARAGDEGRLFGSVTAADVAEAIQAQHGVAVDRRD